MYTFDFNYKLVVQTEETTDDTAEAADDTTDGAEEVTDDSAAE